MGGVIRLEATVKNVVLVFAIGCVACGPSASAGKDQDVAAWERQARNITIVPGEGMLRFFK